MKKIFLLNFILWSTLLTAQRTQYGITANFGNFGLGKNLTINNYQYQYSEEINSGNNFGIGGFLRHKLSNRLYIGVEPAFQIGYYQVKTLERYSLTSIFPDSFYSHKVQSQIQQFALHLPIIMGVSVGQSNNWRIEFGGGIIARGHANSNPNYDDAIIYKEDYTSDPINWFLTNRVFYQLNPKTSFGVDGSFQLRNTWPFNSRSSDIYYNPIFSQNIGESYLLRSLSIRLQHTI